MGDMVALKLILKRNESVNACKYVCMCGVLMFVVVHESMKQGVCGLYH